MPADPATALHRYAVKLFDKEDGRAVDWPMVAAMLFKAGLSCWDEAGRSERAMQVLAGSKHMSTIARPATIPRMVRPSRRTCLSARRPGHLPSWPINWTRPAEADRTGLLPYADRENCRERTGRRAVQHGSRVISESQATGSVLVYCRRRG